MTAVVLPPLDWRESPNQSARTREIRTVVLHDTEGAYEGAVSWLCDPRAEASAHLVLREDGLAATQLVPWSHKAWHCAAYNDQSIGLEMAGQAKRGFSNAQLAHAARIVAYFLHRYNLPGRYVKPDSHGILGPGWTLHQDLGVPGGGHHDPGFSGLRTWQFGRLVKAELKRGGFRKEWGRG
jgi:N-acetyl-anhydromuramyl-L-alanine amidase AmpD